MPPTPTTRWQQHLKKWGEGCGSEECPHARHVCLARGSLPCTLLFVGEAPGESEDTLGRPFCGPAGRLLDDAIITPVLREIEENGHTEGIMVAYTNLVACIPRDGDKKASEPLPEQIVQCQPRLADLIQMADPMLIVCVGALAEHWLKPDFKGSLKLPGFVPQVKITHPAAILRANVIVKGLMVQQAQVILKCAIEEFIIERREHAAPHR